MFFKLNVFGAREDISHFKYGEDCEIGTFLLRPPFNPPALLHICTLLAYQPLAHLPLHSLYPPYPVVCLPFSLSRYGLLAVLRATCSPSCSPRSCSLVCQSGLHSAACLRARLCAAGTLAYFLTVRRAYFFSFLSVRLLTVLDIPTSLPLHVECHWTKGFRPQALLCWTSFPLKPSRRQICCICKEITS